MSKPLRIHTSEATKPGLLAPISLQVPQELADITSTGDGSAIIKIRDFVYREGKFYPILSVKQLKK